MKCVMDYGPEARYECSSGHEFWVDAVFEENLYVCQKNGHRHLLAECPTCGEKEECDLFCMNVAPSHIACCVPPDDLGIFRTPWCHLLCGHEGPHVCGQFKWEE